MNYTNKIIALSMLCAICTQTSFTCSDCEEHKVTNKEEITKACPCSLPKPQNSPKPTNKDEKEILVSDLAEKIIILKSKTNKIEDPEKVETINQELKNVAVALKDKIQDPEKLKELAAKLYAINQELLEISEK